MLGGKRLKNYMTQPFFVAEDQRGEKGQFVTVSETVNDVESILAGKLDEIEAERLLFIGSLREAKVMNIPKNG